MLSFNVLYLSEDDKLYARIGRAAAAATAAAAAAAAATAVAAAAAAADEIRSNRPSRREPGRAYARLHANSIQTRDRKTNY